MDTIFPFGMPLSTAFYLIMFVVTLAIHVIFMNYVLAGTAWLAVSYLRGTNRDSSSSSGLLREWLPVMLSGAITAGIAPLLFLQILYKREYYTANLLLFNRWMAILPVLIVGFYALYILKSHWLSRRPNWVALVVSLVPIFAVAFTGYSWTENHLLSVRSPEFWGEFYATSSQLYSEAQLLPRLAMWAVGSIPTLVLILAWQHWYRGTGEPRKLAIVALVGMGLVGAAAAWYALVTDSSTRDAFISPLAWPYFTIAGIGVLLQVGGWFRLTSSSQYSLASLIVPTVGLTMTILGMTVCREAVRIVTLGKERFEGLYSIHAEAFQKGGLFLFLGFFAVNGFLCAFVFWLVKHRSISETTEATENVES